MYRLRKDSHNQVNTQQRATEKINKTKSYFLEKINKNDKSLARLRKEREDYK